MGHQKSGRQVQQTTVRQRHGFPVNVRPRRGQPTARFRGGTGPNGWVRMGWEFGDRNEHWRLLIIAGYSPIGEIYENPSSGVVSMSVVSMMQLTGPGPDLVSGSEEPRMLLPSFAPQAEGDPKDDPSARHFCNR